MTTFAPKKSDIERKWYLVDAQNLVLGRLATRLADILRGKDKPTYAHHMDMGDFVIVINAEKIKLTGNKLQQKKYRSHSGYPGGLKEKTAGEVLEKHPEKIIEKAVLGMLPRNKLRDHIIRKLKVYRGDSHPHQAQTPEPLTLEM